MNTSAASSQARSEPNPPPLPKIEARSPLAQLLHALNQPLTGLQCSMEVALASPRTPEQYVRGLREGLELTERMRVLVEAIREVTALEEASGEEIETVELNQMLSEALDDLAPVAEMKNVRIVRNGPGDSRPTVKVKRRMMSTAIFRLLESTLSLATAGSVLSIEMGSAAGEAWFRVRWHAVGLQSPFSRTELGLLIAQASMERAGARWQRKRAESAETVTVRLASVIESRGQP